MSKRIENLRKELMDVSPSICAERAIIFTETFKRTKEEPLEIRRAKALRDVLEKMSIHLRENELIVGNQAGKLGAAPVFPETQSKWVLEQLDSFEKRDVHRFEVDEESKKILREKLNYWEGKTVLEKGPNYLPEETRKVYEMEYPIISPNINLRGGIGHIIANYRKILNNGFGSIKREAEKRINENEMTINKLQFYKSIVIICDGVIAFAHRYAEKAKKLAVRESDQKRKKELEQIASICRKVPEKPADTFWEALQSFWFIHLIIQIESDGLAVSPGRFDQYIYPFYKKDIEKNKLSRKWAQELLNSLWIKFNEVKQLADLPPEANYNSAFTMSQNLIIGGVNENGEDATNDLSYLILEAEKTVAMTQPALSLRLHEKTPDKLLMESTKLIKKGGGKPAIFNDEIIIPSLLNDGVSLEDARDYGVVGCVEPTPSNNCFALTNAAMFNLAKCLELAIFGGECPLSGDKYYSQNKIESFSDLLNAFKEQVKHYVKHMVIMLNTWEHVHSKNVCLPYLSILIDDCLGEGKDVTKGGAFYNFTGPQGVGVADVADSLAAIKKIVFEKELLTFDSLKLHLANNFEDSENIRQLLINKAPKYGNDNDYVDSIAHEIGKFYCAVVRKYSNTREGNYRPGLYSVAAHVPLGAAVGALPNGKKSREQLTDGISPVHGCDLNGPTSVIKSASKIDHLLASNGTNLNPKLHPITLKTKEDLSKFIHLLRTHGQLKNMHIQFNVVSKETLIKAKDKPDQYRSLLVRVSGYSAFFVELGEELQNDIIGRTEHSCF